MRKISFFLKILPKLGSDLDGDLWFAQKIKKQKQKKDNWQIRKTNRKGRQTEKEQIVNWTERNNDWKHKKLFLNKKCRIDRDRKIKERDWETERQISTSKQRTEDVRQIKWRQHGCRKKKKERLKDELINRQTTKNHFWKTKQKTVQTDRQPCQEHKERLRYREWNNWRQSKSLTETKHWKLMKPIDEKISSKQIDVKIDKD